MQSNRMCKLASTECNHNNRNTNNNNFILIFLSAQQSINCSNTYTKASVSVLGLRHLLREMEPILSHSRGAQEIHLFILLGHLSERRTIGQPLGIEAHRQTECVRAQGRIDEIVTRSMLSDVLRVRVHIFGSGRFYRPFV